MSPTVKSLLIFGAGIGAGFIGFKLLSTTGIPVIGVSGAPPDRAAGAPPIRRIAEDMINMCDEFRPVLRQMVVATAPGSESGQDISTGELYSLFQQMNRLG